MKLHLGGFLSFFPPEKKGWLDIPMDSPAPLGRILSSIGVPISEVYLTVVNGEQMDLASTVVSDSDVVHLYPPIDGG